jgi:hypothetical protein
MDPCAHQEEAAAVYGWAGRRPGVVLGQELPFLGFSWSSPTHLLPEASALQYRAWEAVLAVQLRMGWDGMGWSKGGLGRNAFLSYTLSTP